MMAPIYTESPAFDVQFGGKPETPMLQRVDADAWFDRHNVSWFQIREQRFGQRKMKR